MHHRLSNLAENTVAELVQALATLPDGVTSLDLRENCLGYKTGAALAKAFRSIPDSVTSLNLSKNSLGAKLTRNFFGQKTGTKLAQAFKALPVGLSSLNLSGNCLSEKTVAELVQAIRKLPARLRSLNLSDNSLNHKTSAELAQVFAEIPDSVTSLDLSLNLLAQKTGAELAQVMAAIPVGVSSLNLSWNFLSVKTVAELAQVFAKIPDSVTSLNLSGNNLRQKTGDELAQVFAKIPVSVTSLDLSGNDLYLKTADELARVFAAIPTWVSDIIFSSRDIQGKTQSELLALSMALPYVMNVFIGNKSGSLPAVGVGEKALVSLPEGSWGFTEPKRILEGYLIPEIIPIILAYTSGVSEKKISEFFCRVIPSRHSAIMPRHAFGSDGYAPPQSLLAPVKAEKRIEAPNYSFIINCLAGLSTAVGVALLIGAICTSMPVTAGVAGGLILTGIGIKAISSACFYSKRKPAELGFNSTTPDSKINVFVHDPRLFGPATTAPAPSPASSPEATIRCSCPSVVCSGLCDASGPRGQIRRAPS